MPRNETWPILLAATVIAAVCELGPALLFKAAPAAPAASEPSATSVHADDSSTESVSASALAAPLPQSSVITLQSLSIDPSCVIALQECSGISAESALSAVCLDMPAPTHGRVKAIVREQLRRSGLALPG